MAFIATVGAPDATGDTADMYAAAIAANGYLPNMTQLFGHRPEVMRAWAALVGSIRANMPLRRYELVTLAAARELTSSYCMLAHGRAAMREGISEAALRSIAAREASDELTDAEQAVITLAARVVRDATGVTQADVDAVRAHGLADAEVFDVVAAAAVRCFFSKTLDALGAAPDADYNTYPSDVRDALTVGRPIE